VAEIRVDRLVLDGADALLETDRKDRGNWHVGNIYRYYIAYRLIVEH
jgi:hypothetical protein